MAKRIYYYPNDDGRLSTITLPKVSAAHELAADRDRVDRVRGDGSTTTVYGLSKRRVQLVAERGLRPVEDAAVLRKLEHLEDHLCRGGVIGLALDTTKAWAAWGSAAYAGKTYVHTSTASAMPWETGAAVAAGDEVIVESCQPQGYRSRHLVSALNTGLVTLDSGEPIPQDMIGVMVRHRDFYPALRLPVDQLGKPIVTTENRLIYSLDVTLEACPEIIAAGFVDVYGFEPSDIARTLGSTSTPNAVGTSLDRMLAGVSAGPSLRDRPSLSRSVTVR